MLDALYTAAEMKAAEAGHDVPMLMERYGAAAAAPTLSSRTARPIAKPKEFTATPGNETK